MWWLIEEIKDIIARKKAAFKELCRFPSEENKTQYKCLKNQITKIDARAIRKEAEQELMIYMYIKIPTLFSASSEEIKRKGRIWKEKMLNRKRRTVRFYS